MLRTRLLIYLVLAFAPPAEASWLCEEAASIRDGQLITACGIGESKKEDQARKQALKSAFEELDLVCKRSADCRDYELNIEPLRNDCQKTGPLYKCYRAINAEITHNKKAKVDMQGSEKKKVETEVKISTSEALNRIDQLIKVFSKKQEKVKAKVGEKICDYNTDQKFSLFSDLTSSQKIKAGALEARKVPFRQGCLQFHFRLMSHLNRHNKRSPVYEKYLLSQLPGLTAAPKDNRLGLILKFFHHYGPYRDDRFDLFFESFKRSYSANHYHLSGLLFHSAKDKKSKTRQQTRLNMYINAAEKAQLGRPVHLSSDQSFINLIRGLSRPHFNEDPGAYRYVMNKIYKAHQFKDTRSWTANLSQFLFKHDDEKTQQETINWISRVISRANSDESVARFLLNFVKKISQKISKFDDEEAEGTEQIKKWEKLKKQFLSQNADKIDKVFAANDKGHLQDNFYDFCINHDLECSATLPSVSQMKKMLKSKEYQKRLLALNILSKKPETAKTLIPEVYDCLKEARKKRRRFFRVIGPSVEVLAVANVDQSDIIAEMLDVSWNREYDSLKLAKQLGKKLVPELKKVINNNNSKYQRVAIKTLGLIGSPAKEVLPELKRLADKNQLYSDEAQKSIDQIEEP